MINYETALEWTREYLQENYPNHLQKSYLENVNTWSGDFIEFTLFTAYYEIPMLMKEVNEFRDHTVFQFIVPSTKKEFFQVLEILDKS